jgi:hypothetical protein
MEMTQENIKIDIPGNLLVECPLTQKKLRAVKNCQGCVHFKGLLDRFPGAAHMRFAQRYMIGCRYPFGRALFEVAEETDDSP